MKANIRKEEIGFEPFILEIKIENLAEAKELWKLFNEKPNQPWSAMDFELVKQGFNTEDWISL